MLQLTRPNTLLLGLRAAGSAARLHGGDSERAAVPVRDSRATRITEPKTYTYSVVRALLSTTRAAEPSVPKRNGVALASD